MIIQLCIMLSVKQSGFLQKKIKHIQTAILHCPDDEFFNMQAVMARVLKLDQEGCLWLSVDKPIDCSGTGVGSFDIVLNYHQHGESFDLDILGEAHLLTTDEISSLPAAFIKEHRKGKLILQVNILDLDYLEHKPPVYQIIAQKIRYMFHSHGAGHDKQHIYPERQMSA